MANSELLVDGSNVLWAWPRTRHLLLNKDHGAAQRLLVSTATQSALRTSYQQLTFVFDGPPPATGPSSSAGVRVLYPDLGQSADERIVELVAQAVHGGISTMVATSDRGLRDLVRRKGGTTMGGQALLQKMDPRGSLDVPRGDGGEEGKDPEKPRPSSRDTESWLARFSSKKRPPK
ncbi:MAG TPA: NYN domain-containing protein [Candidatus Dormibacteraeota bacterium]|nr:NYN domain-containing protein [Candidatus Dormibacteraeota bacterium]